MHCYSCHFIAPKNTKLPRPLINAFTQKDMEQEESTSQKKAFLWSLHFEDHTFLTNPFHFPSSMLRENLLIVSAYIIDQASKVSYFACKSGLMTTKPPCSLDLEIHSHFSYFQGHELLRQLLHKLQKVLYLVSLSSNSQKELQGNTTCALL